MMWGCTPGPAAQQHGVTQGFPLHGIALLPTAALYLCLSAVCVLPGLGKQTHPWMVPFCGTESSVSAFHRGLQGEYGLKQSPVLEITLERKKLCVCIDPC